MERHLPLVMRISMDVRKEGLQLFTENLVIMGAPQSSLISELVEGNATVWARLLIEAFHLLGSLSNNHMLGQLLGHLFRCLCHFNGRFVTPSEIFLGVLFAKVDLHRRRTGQFCDVIRRRAIAFLTFHKTTL